MTARRTFFHRLMTYWETDRSLSALAGFLAFATFCVAPFTDESTIGVIVLELSFALVLLAGIAAVARTRIWARVLVPVAILTIAARIAAAVLPHALPQLARPAASLLFCALLIVVVSERVLRGGAVTVHRILGAVAVYLLIGVVWAQAYDLVDQLVPGALSTPTPDPPHDVAHFIYYSFATLTTVGYGDLVAVHPIARSLAMLEAVIGQLYSAILVARLVGLSLRV
jgi:hypothetical protein